MVAIAPSISEKAHPVSTGSNQGVFAVAIIRLLDLWLDFLAARDSARLLAGLDERMRRDIGLLDR